MSWTTAELAAAAEAQRQGPGDLRIEAIVTDSRRVTPGSLFVALHGESFDGHTFVAGAWAAGAGAVLVSQPVAAPPDRAVLLVDDTLLAYGRLGAWWRGQFPSLQLAAITGSLGKTTTKELTWQVLHEAMPTLKSASSFNNEIGVPATLLELTAAHRAAVLELAMRGPGEIDYLARLVQPQIGAITNIGHSHLGRLGSRQAIAAAKGELLDHLGSQGIAVLNADDDHLAVVSRRHAGRTVWYGLDQPAEVSAEAVRLDGLAGVSFRLRLPDSQADVSAPVAGRHMVSNALAAAAIGYAAGLDAATIAAGLAHVPDLRLRQELLTLPNGARILNDAYNAAPESVRAALAVLAAESAAGRRIAVLGGIAELGEVTEVEHLRLGRDAAGLVDVLVGVGPEGAQIVAGAEHTGVECHTLADASAARAWLSAQLRTGDLVLLKASRAYGLERALEGLQ